MGAVIFEGPIPDSLDEGQSGEGFPIDVFNVLGAGDGFMSGLLRGWLKDEDWPTSLKFANACGAFAVSRHGCTPAYPSWEELQYFFRTGIRNKALRKDAALEQIHWSTNRNGNWPHMRVFAFDHRIQLEEMAAEAGVSTEKIGEFKQLCLNAALQVANGSKGYGILCDGRLGRDALYRAAGTGLWIGRPTEWPGSRPLKLEPELGPDCGGLVEWPVENVVKSLCFYHPDDPAEFKAQQEETVLRLFAATRRNRLEFLFEIIPSKAGPVDDNTSAHVIERFYEIGVYPDWWKLEPMKTKAAWANACDAITRNDAHTRGIVVLGLDAPVEELEASLAIAAEFDLVKGFAVGRTIFGDAARKWLNGSMSDEESSRRHGRTLSQPLQRLGQRAQILSSFCREEAGGAMRTIRLTAAQALVRYLANQLTPEGETFIAGVWAIFGHGNVAGLGEALYGIREELPTWRGHNEQTMAHAAIAYTKQLGRKRACAVTSSIGPGATNMVTAAALAHVNRLPVLLIPGDVFANRGPDPVLQQIQTSMTAP
jgi:myo-inositol catabolism protein IolC